MKSAMDHLSPALAELNDLKEDVRILERQLHNRRKERDNLALEIIDTGMISLRKVAKYAGVSNVRLVQLRKERNNGN